MFLHLDLDAFFVSAERILNPSLLGKPVAVGKRGDTKIFSRKRMNRQLIDINSGAFVQQLFYDKHAQRSFSEYFIDEDKRVRGIIITSSYEARSFGIKTGMSIQEALHLCPNLQVIPPNDYIYHELSHKLFILLQGYIPQIEQFSIDEFFGDLSGWIDKEEDIIRFAHFLKTEIEDKLSLPISIGIAHSKWTAKLATNMAKPHGIKLVREQEISSFIQDIKIDKFPGIGKGFYKRLTSYGIQTLGEVKEAKALFYSWKKPGISLYHRVCGSDNEPIKVRSPKKSIAIGRSFPPVEDRMEIKRRIMILCRHLSYIIHHSQLNPMTYYLYIKYEYFIKEKKSITLNRVFSEKLFKQTMLDIYTQIDIHKNLAVIALHMNVSRFSNLVPTSSNILFHKEDDKQQLLTHKLQSLRLKYGLDIIKDGNEF